MNRTSPLKMLVMLGLTSLTLAAPVSQADNGFIYFGSNPNTNPWMSGPAYQQARFQAAMKERVAHFEQRQDAQLQRILGGMENGQLTMREAVDLLREHVSIGVMQRNYMADGRLGPNELRDLEQRLDEANQHIRFEKHDRDQRPMGRPNDIGRPGDWGRPGDADRR
jgi:hypothetical protein